MLQETLKRVEDWRALFELVKDTPNGGPITERCEQKLHQLELDLQGYRPKAGRVPTGRSARSWASRPKRP